MSLLLEALQKAARNREAATPAETKPTLAAPAPQAAAPAASQSAPPSDRDVELSLEPMAAEPRVQWRDVDEPPAKPAAAASATPAASPSTPAQAQTVLRAGGGEARRGGIFATLRDRPVIAIGTVAGLFAIGYGVYLYLQITNPGLFIATRPAPPSAPAQPVAPRPAEPSPAPVVATATEPPPSVPGPAATAAPVPSVPASAPQVPPAVPSASTPAAAAATAAVPPPEPAAKAAAASPSTAQTAAAPPAASRPPAEVSSPRPGAPSARGTPAAKPAAGDMIAVDRGNPQATVNPALATAWQTLEQGRPADAEREYRQILSTEPRNMDAMLGLASALVQQGKADAATQVYMRVLENDPKNSHAQAGLIGLMGRADPVAAEARLRHLISREPSAFLHFTLGNLLAEQRQWAPAQAAYFQAHTMAPDNPDYAFNLAVGLEHVSQPKIALNYYRRAAQLARERGSAQFDVARVEGRIRALEAAVGN